MVKVSVIILTYNHEKWIDDAVESVLNQSISSEVEIIIHDDCSTDGTLTKVLQWRDKHPDLIRVISAPENLHSKNRFQRRIVSLINEESRGAYFHILDGDDYWSDKDKLRKQTSFLDANPEFSMCFHNVNLVSEGGEFLSELIPPDMRKDYSGISLRRFNFAYLHLSALCLRNFKSEFPGEYFLSKNGDHFFPFAYGTQGGAKFLGEVLPSCYRQTGHGVWSGISPMQKKIDKLQTGFLMASCLLSIGDAKFALMQLTQRIIPVANEILGALPDRDL